MLIPFSKLSPPLPPTTLHRLHHFTNAIHEKDGQDLVFLDLRAQPSATLRFLFICQADTHIQRKSIVDNVEKRIAEHYGEYPYGKELGTEWQWLLMDYIDLVLHVFSPSYRLFYALENLWGDAPILSLQAQASYQNIKY